MDTAKIAAFFAPALPIAMVPTGTPPGICTVAKSASKPSNGVAAKGTLTTGIMVFRNAPWEIAAIAAAAGADALWSTEVTNGHYEVIVTTSMVNNNLYLMRKSDIYYINDVDFWQYQPTRPAGEIELTSFGF